MPREHRTDLPWPCSCDDCTRRAAGAWIGLMNRVRSDELSIEEANAIMDLESPQ